MQVAMGIEDSPELGSWGGLETLIKTRLAEALNRDFEAKGCVHYFWRMLTLGELGKLCLGSCTVTLSLFLLSKSDVHRRHRFQNFA
jgi:hypothetical protein